jgi:hypothetical protein
MIARDDSPVTIRRAYPDDAGRLRHLAQLDSERLTQAELLVAEVDDELLAAVAVDHDWAIADPFRHTAALVDLLRMRAHQLRLQRRGDGLAGYESPARLASCQLFRSRPLPFAMHPYLTSTR